MKHVGRHNNNKLVLVFRQLPTPQDHMALVLYSNSLPQNYHDDLMKVLESDVGQQAKDFADALHRHVFNDGRNMLNILHHNGWLKKVPTSQIIVEANAKSQCRLDELNKILTEMATGEEAATRLRDLDRNAGVRTPAEVRGEGEEQHPAGPRLDPSVAENEAALAAVTKTVTEAAPVADGVLTIESIAKNTLQQADMMEEQMTQLQEEAARLRNEAYEMAPFLKPKQGRGRPKKGVTVA